MKKMLWIGLLLVLAFVAGCTPAQTPSPTPSPTEAPTPSPSPSPSPTPTPIVPGDIASTGTATVTSGVLMAVEPGEIVRALLRTSGGEERWFAVSTECGLDFEALPLYQKLSFAWQNCDVYTDALGTVANMDAITDASLLE